MLSRTTAGAAHTGKHTVYDSFFLRLTGQTLLASVLPLAKAKPLPVGISPETGSLPN